MWFVSKVQYQERKKNKIKQVEKYFVHVAEGPNQVKSQLDETMMRQTTEFTHIAKPVMIPATVNGNPAKLFIVRIPVGGRKYSTQVLSAADENDAIRRGYRYLGFSGEKMGHVTDVTSVTPVRQKEIQRALFG